MALRRLKMIVGHVTDTSARIWVQGAASHPRAQVALHGTDGSVHQQTLLLPGSHEHTGVADFTGLSADTRYTCFVQLQGAGTESARGGFRTFPVAGQQPPEFDFTVVSCNARSPQTKRDYMAPVWTNVRNNARFVLHTGDNIYYDKKPNNGHKPTLERYVETYNRVWGGEGLGDLGDSSRKILSECPNLMILDDHEITNNYEPDEEEEAFKHGIRAYSLFQHAHNPPTPEGQFYYTFSYGDVEFFVMDVRLERDRNSNNMISAAQEEALLAWLSAHRDALKFVVSSVPFWCHPAVDVSDKWASRYFRRQRDRIIRFLAGNQIQGLVFITGDMHASYHHTTTVRRNDLKLRYHELMSGPVDHRVRSRFFFDARKRWTVGPWALRSRGFVAFTQKRSAMNICVNARTRTISYRAFRTRKDKTIFSGTFSV